MEGKTVLGYWAHAWRKLVEAIKENWKLAYIIYSSIAICKAWGIETREWFEEAIRRVPE